MSFCAVKTDRDLCLRGMGHSGMEEADLQVIDGLVDRRLKDAINGLDN